MQHIRIAGVPEHYNLPLYQLQEEQALKDHGLTIEWSPYSTGTGAMLADLRANELDMAILLTEGSMVDQLKDDHNQIVSRYVNSPLVWGVHTHTSHPFSLDSGINGYTRFGISRPLSGSHLMAYLYARQFGVQLTKDNFVVVGNMPGAEKAMANGEVDLFMWEKFTTKPLVDKGVFQRVDEFPTPWNSFVIVSRREFAESHPNAVMNLVRWLSHRTKQLRQNSADTIREISSRFELKETDVAEWFAHLEWDVRLVNSASEFDYVAHEMMALLERQKAAV